MVTKKKTLIIVLLILLLLALVLGGIFVFRKIYNAYFQPLRNDNGSINLLFLGINGSGGEDKNLTDTIIFASVNQNANKITLLSVPRDVWIENLKAKINAAYHFGGIDLAKKTISEVLDQPVHYYAVLNFDSFEKIIDFLGGVEVNVERAFDDYKFPIAGKEKDLCNGDRQLKCRYEHLRFEAGAQILDGKTALKFVRSRNAAGEEGNDFSRSARQQKILLGIKNKLTDPKFYDQQEKAIGLLQLIQREIITDVKPEIYGSLAVLGYDLNKKGVKVEPSVLNGNLLITPKYHYSRQWVLVPRDKDFQEIHEFVKSLLD